ncbi:MAG TPA: metal-dependent hydrolase [Bradyrhizobium sp.]|jgi:L-ascorbate metabolism protein UlaG (beta-lactamase superfamily)|nr:metal-dependent hydrolase [Bradyrhizobium sp.]
MFKRVFVYAVCIICVAIATTREAPAQSGKIEILWLGQSAFRITTPTGKVIITDPWLTPNPKTPPEYKDLAKLGRIDVILVSHAHYDHLYDAPALARMHNVPIIGPAGMNNTLLTLGALPLAQLPRFNKGGTTSPYPGIKITATHAEHSSELTWRSSEKNSGKPPLVGLLPSAQDETAPGGEPIGFIIELENGFKIYHAGDTGLFGDMKMIGEYYKPDLVMLPIGGNFTMDPKDAAYATREMLKPKYAIPMHYGANPLGVGTPQQFIDALGTSPVKVFPMNPGEKIEF